MPSTEERLVELETRIAYQEDALNTLGEELARQKREYELLLDRLRGLQSKIDAGDLVYRGTAREEIPPHY